ncbi:MAG: TonB-dependent receptor [Terrimonas sp.]|nr:TonB-dependent receptor [Terrimonas sp.]
MKLWKLTRAPYKGSPLVTQTWRIMKLIVIFMISGCLTAAANGFGQMVNISEKNISLEKVFRLIKKQTGYSFLYTETQLQHFKKINVNLKDAELEKALQVCFANQLFTYSIVEKTIVVKNLLHPDTQQQEATIEITGRVTDSAGNGLYGASIKIKGTNSGTSTASDGTFSLQSQADDIVLVVSYVDYETKEITISKNQTSFQIILKKKESELNQVVVVGYGSQRKKDITGSVSTLSSKDIENRGNTQFGYAIEGKAAGVQVIRPSGQPQAGFSIRIRGTSTITAGSEPLYLIDGVPTESTNEINPADIENITVLKDASAAAIYGASGANGVVLITTKRGKNQKTKVSFDTYQGMSEVWKKIDVLNAAEYKTLMNEMGQSVDWSKYTADNNWQDQVFRTAHTQSYQLGITGGNENTGYYISGSWLKQQGVVITNELNRGNFKINLDHKVNRWLKVGTSINYSRWKDIDVTENAKYGAIMSVLTGAPVTNVYNDDGTFTLNPFIQDLENPVALILKNKHDWINYRFNGNAYAEFSLAAPLKFRTMFGVEQLNGNYQGWVDPYTSREGRGFKGIADLTSSQTSYWISENTLTYNKTIAGKHNITAIGGFVVSRKNTSSSWIHGTGFGSDAIPNVSGASIKTSGAASSARKNVSALSRINYTYDDRYLLTANFRADASSVFNNSDNVWGYFPSFSAGWRISKESFFNRDGWLNDLKLRAGWGSVGNDQVGDYASYGLVSASGNYVIGGVITPGTAVSSLENKNLKWETTQQTDIGVDAAILNNRILFTADYYIKQTTNMLLDRPIPGSVGIPGSTAIKNIGKMENRGFEFQVSSKNLTGKLKWGTDFNISFNRSKIISLDGGTIKIGNISERGTVAIAQEGKPLGLFYGYISEGVDPATGNIIYRDIDKSGDLSDGDQTIIGNANPKYFFGLTNNFSYGNFTFSFFVQGVQGNDIFNATRIETEGLIDEANQTKNVLNRWTTAGQVTNIPKATYGDNTNSLISSRFIENGSFVRLKSATLGYTLPEAVTNRLKISRCFLYVTGENIFTFTKYSGFDPEVSLYGRSGSSEKNIAPGIDYGTYPQSRDFIIGLNITF